MIASNERLAAYSAHSATCVGFGCFCVWHFRRSRHRTHSYSRMTHIGLTHPPLQTDVIELDDGSVIERKRILTP